MTTTIINELVVEIPVSIDDPIRHVPGRDPLAVARHALGGVDVGSVWYLSRQLNKQIVMAVGEYSQIDQPFNYRASVLYGAGPVYGVVFMWDDEQETIGLEPINQTLKDFL